jgi:hypothetical protein
LKEEHKRIRKEVERNGSQRKRIWKGEKNDESKKCKKEMKIKD